MAVMIFDKDRKAVRRLVKKYGMLESDAREMLAIERGVISGDVKEVSPAEAARLRSRHAGRPGRALLVWGLLLQTLHLAR